MRSPTSKTYHTVERWWLEMCKRHDQEPCDPDAFFYLSQRELRERCEQFKAEFGHDPVEVEIPDWL